jgi:hypothetical protein
LLEIVKHSEAKTDWLDDNALQGSGVTHSLAQLRNLLSERGTGGLDVTKMPAAQAVEAGYLIDD